MSGEGARQEQEGCPWGRKAGYLLRELRPSLPHSPVPYLEQVQALQGVKEVKSLAWG